MPNETIKAWQPTNVDITRSGYPAKAGPPLEPDRHYWQPVPMGLIDRLLGRGATPAGTATTTKAVRPVSEAMAAPAADDDVSADGWYVPRDGDTDRFVSSDGLPPLRLVQYRDTEGEYVMRLCENATGLLVGPSDRRLPRAGIYISQLRGEAYHQEACRAGNFYPGEPVRLVREPDNPHDPNAVAVYDATGTHLAAYVNKQKARLLTKLLDTGIPIEAISIRGTRANVACDQIAILAASPEVLRHLLGPRPPGAATPAFTA